MASACEPYRELIELGLIELGLARERNAVAIWQDGFAGRFHPQLSESSGSCVSCAARRRRRRIR